VTLPADEALIDAFNKGYAEVEVGAGGWPDRRKRDAVRAVAALAQHELRAELDAAVKRAEGLQELLDAALARPPAPERERLLEKLGELYASATRWRDLECAARTERDAVVKRAEAAEARAAAASLSAEAFKGLVDGWKLRVEKAERQRDEVQALLHSEGLRADTLTRGHVVQVARAEKAEAEARQLREAGAEALTALRALGSTQMTVKRRERVTWACIALDGALKVPKGASLSADAIAARTPRPPHELVGALQDPVHVDLPGGRAAKSVKVRLTGDEGPKTFPSKPGLLAGQRYRHYKGGTYVGVGLSKDEATGATYVVYRSEADGQMWHRPIDNFFDSVEGLVPRFQEISADEPIGTYDGTEGR
jgi:hypothetical protein